MIGKCDFATASEVAMAWMPWEDCTVPHISRLEKERLSVRRLQARSGYHSIILQFPVDRAR